MLSLIKNNFEEEVRREIERSGVVDEEARNAIRKQLRWTFCFPLMETKGELKHKKWKFQRYLNNM